MTETPRPPISLDPASAHDPLASYLAEVERDACFRVERILKESAYESTQVVYFAGANGAELGPFVRKLIKRGAGIGAAYRELNDAHRRGVRPRHLPAVYDVHEAGEELVVLMEHVPGVTLRELVRNASPNERPALTRRVMPALCAAATELHTAFAQPIVHRDLTPSNVICNQADPANLTVVDLGIAREHKPEANVDTAYFGTRPYAPPEQFGFGQTTPQTDVYALGITLFFCLTGRDATPADRKAAFADPAIPEPLRLTIERAAHLDPASRHKTANDLKHAVELAFCAPFDLAASSSHAGAQASQGGPKEEGKPDRRVSAIATKAGRIVPNWLGRIWNLVLALAYAVVLLGCFFAATDPSEAIAHLPKWLLIYDYGVFLNLAALSTAALLWDKRRIRERFKRLPNPGMPRTLTAYILFTVLNIVLFYLANLIGNPLYA